MASKFRIFTKRFLIFTNIAVVFFFLLSCLASYLNPQKWWFVSLFGLAFPVLLLLVIFFLVMWLVVKPRLSLLSLAALLISIKSVLVFFAFRGSSFHQEKKPGTIRVVDWNVARFVEMKRNNNKGSQMRLKMMEQIKAQNADILCLQEFFHSVDSTYYPNIDYIKNNLGYPYWYYSHDNDGDKHFTGSIIFSRFPIIDSGMIRYPRPTLPDALMHADILINNDTIRVYTTHLQSLQFDKGDYEKINEIKKADDSLIAKSRTIFSKIKRGIVSRSLQANIIDQVLDDCPYPILFCADLNDIPNSYTYHTVKGDMQDAFLKKGFGVGRTFSALSPTLRIDYIFADKSFKVLQYNRILKRYSDHYMIVSDLELRK
jgi:endonuclease/exonuclease/phosphatase family metal-dependent hydrolase